MTRRYLFKKNREAASEVIGIILSLGITVSIAVAALCYVGASSGFQSPVSPPVIEWIMDQNNAVLTVGSVDPSTAQWEDVKFIINDNNDYIALYPENTGPILPGDEVSLSSLKPHDKTVYNPDPTKVVGIQVVYGGDGPSTLISSFTAKIPKKSGVVNPPSLTDPIPEDGAKDVSSSFVEWSIDISYSKGSFSYTIECNGIQTEGTGNVYTKGVLELKNLNEKTTYTVQVTATGSQGGVTTESFTFTTGVQARGGHQPLFGDPNPEDNAIDQPTRLTFSIPISDPGDTFSYSIVCSNGQEVSEQDATDGIKTLDLKLKKKMQYQITVTATDTDDGTTEQTYTFTTEGATKIPSAEGGGSTDQTGGGLEIIPSGNQGAGEGSFL